MKTLNTEDVGTTLQLRDGRLLGYAEYGDLTGQPVFLLHGFPDCRITRNPDDALTASLRVRLIIPDRPGIGLSSFKPARSLLERVDDVAELADALGLARFAVLGWSAGGPYALACAYKFPERLTGVGVACGFTPMDRPWATEGMSKQMQQGIALMRRLPWMTRLVTASVRGQYRKDPEKAFQKQFGQSISAADAQVLAQPEIRANLLAGAVEAWRQGARGPALEGELLFARPWGFRPEEITRDVFLWYGDADAVVPLQMGQYLAAAIPRSHLIICHGQGHLLLVQRWEEILRTLTGR
jgi:pimeloyl-ACP methyl ester carboxylesterase